MPCMIFIWWLLGTAMKAAAAKGATKMATAKAVGDLLGKDKKKSKKVLGKLMGAEAGPPEPPQAMQAPAYMNQILTPQATAPQAPPRRVAATRTRSGPDAALMEMSRGAPGGGAPAWADSTASARSRATARAGQSASWPTRRRRHPPTAPGTPRSVAIGRGGAAASRRGLRARRTSDSTRAAASSPTFSCRALPARRMRPCARIARRETMVSVRSCPSSADDSFGSRPPTPR